MTWFSYLFWPCQIHILCWRHLWQPFLGHSKSVCYTYRQLEGLSTPPGGVCLLCQDTTEAPPMLWRGKVIYVFDRLLALEPTLASICLSFWLFYSEQIIIWFRSWRYNSVFLPQERTTFPHLQADIGISDSMIWYWLLGISYKIMYKYIIMSILTQINIIYMYIYMHTL